MINHRYSILTKLGEGGSGEVYLVEDTLKQRRQSAMKILYGEDRPARVADEQFRNEVAILAALHHPNLVRVSDFGMILRCDDATLQGRHYFTMEPVHGSTALEWWRNRRKHPDRLVHLKQFVLQALSVLSYVHRQGIIHFDIKPENLLLVSSGENDDQFPLLKLMDFGFSSRQNATLEFPLRGTLEYTAPELLRRETFDHRVDLYSLGATVYHLIEDRCPFEAADPVELIKKVLTTEPEFHRCAEQEYASMLPLLKNLLQKDPVHRCRSAAGAASVLLEHDQTATAFAFGQLPKPGFAGRERERELIGSAVASLRGDSTSNSSVAMVVAGPEGIGKTALLTEMERIARASGVPVFTVSALQRDLPFDVVRSLLSLLRAEGMSRSSEGAELARRFADVIGGRSESEEGHTIEVQANWMRERDEVVEAQARFINQMSLLFPLMLIIDDAHLLDAESEEVLRIAARDARPGRLLILAAVHGDGSLRIPAHRIQLEELDGRSVSAMSASIVSPVEMGELLGVRLHQLFGGSPALIVEALLSASALLPLKVPSQSAEMTALVESVLGQLPRDLDELLFVRYMTLDRGRQLTLELLSCFSSPARILLIQTVLPFQPQRTAAYLSSLEAEGFVVSHEDGQLFSMRHGRLKAMVYSAIHESRQDSHLIISSTVERLPGVRTFFDLQELAFQYREAGNGAASICWLEAAGDEGMRIAAYRRAKELFLEAVLLGRDLPRMDLDSLNVKLSHAYFRCGDFREAIELAEKQLRKSPREAGQQAALHKIAGLAQSRLGHYEESKRHILTALQFSPDTTETVELQQELVGIEIALGNFAEAERASMVQLDRAKGLDNPRVIASIHTDLGIATFFQNQLDQAAGHFEEARRIYAAAGQHAQLADAMMNIGNVMSAKGDIIRAVEFWSDALKTSQEYGTLNQQAQIQNNLGIAHSKLKRFQEAKTFFEEAKAIFSRLGSKKGNAYVLTNLGEVNFAEGQYEHALSVWQEAGRLYREMDDGQGIVESLLQIAQVHLVLGAVESVDRNLAEAEALTNDRKLDTFRSQLLFLRGMHMMYLNKNEAGRRFFSQSEESSQDEAESERRLLLKVRMAECERRMDRHDPAARLAREAQDGGERMALPQVVAEASYLLGMLAVSSPSSVPEKPLPLFRKGLDAIAAEPVTEITWRLALALGQEFRKRGQGEKAKECLTKAILVLRFFLAQFTSSELKNGYLTVDDKGKVLADLDAYVNT
jgi:tetratricopeptide (TPR) repeat protein